jgi:hypothetical protein
MPHYITEVGEDKFIVYSTIVDGPLTDEMSATNMRKWLDADERYATWLTPYDGEQAAKDWAHGNEGMARLLRDNARWYYWHKAKKFCYVRLIDAYFVLPMEFWRNGE